MRIRIDIDEAERALRRVHAHYEKLANSYLDWDERELRNESFRIGQVVIKIERSPEFNHPTNPD